MPSIVTQDLLEKSQLLKLVDEKISDEKELEARLWKAVDSDHVLCGSHACHQAMGKLSLLAKLAMEKAATQGNDAFVSVFVQQGINKTDPEVKKENSPLFFINACYFGTAFCLALVNGHLNIAKTLHKSQSIVLHHNILRDAVYPNADGTPFTKTPHDLVKETGDTDLITLFETHCVPKLKKEKESLPTLFSHELKSEDAVKPQAAVTTISLSA